MSIARHHAEWLSLIEVSGPFLSMPVLMRVFPQGILAHDPGKFRTLKLAYDQWEDNNEAGARINPALHSAWIKFVLVNILNLPADSILEYQAIPQSLAVSPPGEHAETIRPNLVLNDPATGKPRLLIQTYPLDQDLDKAAAGKSWKASPGTRMMELLHATGVQIGLVTNGQRWMLVDAPKIETTGFASWYANLWIEEKITLQAFFSLLGAERFFGVSEKDTLEQMLKESAGNQQEVTDQLGYQVRNAVEVLVQAIDRINQDRNGDLLAGVPEKLLYEAALTYMMRLVFLFCAEERRLFPLDNELYAQHYAASTLRDQLRRTADDHGEEILERRHDAWSRLLSTFRLVYGGCEHPELRTPAYAGHLFDPDRFTFLEGRKASTSWRNCEADPLPVNNRTVLHLLEALQLLQLKTPGSNERQARRLSFRALDIEQIGHVYEGLLDHTAKRATEPMLGLVGGRDSECDLPLSLLEQLFAKECDKLVALLNERTGRSAAAIRKALGQEIDLHDVGRLRSVCGNDEKLMKRVAPFAGLVRRDTYDYPVVMCAGSIFVTSGTDRRSSGTHYTPRSLTEPIVQHTLDPLAYTGPAEGNPQNQWELRSPKEILDLKICDMACGSGAFLVQGCRYLSERLVEAWETTLKLHPGTPGITPEGEASKGSPNETLIPNDPDERMAYAKRLIAQRCLYGVDINPLAVEMAKLSLWLLTLSKNKPFTFLDHAIRSGDSLVGIHDLKQLKTFSLNGTGQQYVFGEEPLEKLVDEAISHRLAIESSPAETALDLDNKTHDLEAHETVVSFLKCAADFLIAAELRPGNPREKLGHRDDAAIEIAYLRQFDNRNHYENAAAEALMGRHTFHWPLEFPEVVVERGGFDAFVGNPPFMGGQKITGNFGTEYRDYLVAHLARGQRGSADLCAYFFLRAASLLRHGGQFALLATNTIAQGDTREVGLDQLVANGYIILRAVPSRPWPGEASLEVAHVWLRQGKWVGLFVLDEQIVPGITTFLAIPGTVSGKPFRLKANSNKSFQGTILLGMGFTMSPTEAQQLIVGDKKNANVLAPYLNGEDVNSRPNQSPSRWVIDFRDWPLERSAKGEWQSANEASRREWLKSGRVPHDYPGSVAADYPDCLKIVEERVKEERTRKDEAGNFVVRYPRNVRWWQFAERSPDLYATLATVLDEVLVGVRVSKYANFSHFRNNLVFSDSTFVIPLDHRVVFPVCQSAVHESWARKYSSSLETRLRYAPADCFETFPFPSSNERLISSGDIYRKHRQKIMSLRDEGLTQVYNRFHDPNELGNDILCFREHQVVMDYAVLAAYGWQDVDLDHGFHATKQGVRFALSEAARREVLGRVLKLNHERYAEEISQGLQHVKTVKVAKPRSPKAAVKPLDIPLFSGLAYPATDTDRTLCAVAIAIAASSQGLSSMDHLDAVLLAAHRDWCKPFLSAAEAKDHSRAMKGAPKSLFIADDTPVKWKECRDYLERRRAINVDHTTTAQPVELGSEYESVRAALPTGLEEIAAIVLKALSTLKGFKQNLAAASEEQRRFVFAIQAQESLMSLVA